MLELIIKLSMMRNQGSKKKYYHDIIGTNARLDSLQANVLTTKLKRGIVNLMLVLAGVNRHLVCTQIIIYGGLA